MKAFVSILMAVIAWSTATFADADTASPYTRKSPGVDGSGIVYMGRETSDVMGHEGAAWLERPERANEERPGVLVDALGLKPGMTVADVGAGTGYFSWRIAERIAPGGRVIAVDVQPEMIALLDAEMKKRRARNVIGVVGTPVDPRLPAGQVDVALMVDVYHEFDHPKEMLEAIARSLKPDGRVVFVEYRAEDPKVGIKPLHKMSEAQVRREAEAAGLVWRETIRALPLQHIVVFAKPRP